MELGIRLITFFNLILLLIGLAGVIAGAAGTSWWVGGVNEIHKESLWRLCDGTNECINRDNVLKFEENYRGKFKVE